MTQPPLPLSISDVLALLDALGGLSQQVVLIGGQALNYWVEQYLAEGRVPELDVDAPFTSKDIDFCGPRSVVPDVAARLHRGRARQATLDDVTPNVGVVEFEDSTGSQRLIDFLGDPFGMNAADVLRTSVMVDLYDGAGNPTGHQVRVMDPVACMESRVHNVVGLPAQYDTLHGRKQLRASVSCAREALKDVLDTPAIEGFDPVRVTLDLNERIFNFCCHHRHGRLVLQRTGIDPFDAVLVDPRLGEKFIERRWPQMRQRLAAQRAKMANR